MEGRISALKAEARFVEARAVAESLLVLVRASQETTPDRITDVELEVASLKLIATLPEDAQRGIAEVEQLITPLGEHYEKGEYIQACAIAERQLTILRRCLPAEHVDIAKGLNNLGLLKSELGDLREAERLLRQAVDIDRKVLPLSHPGLAVDVNNLAINVLDQGRYPEGEQLFRESLALLRAAKGDADADVGRALDNLADALSHQGDYAGAEQLVREALAIWRNLPRPDSMLVAFGTSSLASVLDDQHRFAEAEPLYREALSIRRRRLGDQHPGVALLLNNLGSNLQEQGRSREAETLIRESLRIRVASTGETNPDVAATMENLGPPLMAQQSFKEAEELYRKSLSIRRQLQGNDHPQVARCLNNLATCHLAMGRPFAAFDEAMEAETIGLRHLKVCIMSTSERMALNQAQTRPSGLSVAISVAAASGSDSVRWVRDSWDAVIQARAAVLDEISARNRVLSGSGSPESAKLSESLARARERLANLVIRGPGGMPPATFQRLCEEARSEKEQAEKDLAAASKLFRREQDRSRARYGTVVRAIPREAALVAFTQGLAPKTSGIDKQRYYYAFVQRHDTVNPILLTIGPTTRVDSLVTAWRDAIRKEDPFSSEEPECRRIGEALRATVWDPIRRRIGEVKLVFLVPEASLNLVSFDALPDSGDRYLAETGPVFDYLSAERDLVVARADTVGTVGLLAVGDPDFDAEGTGDLSSAQAGAHIARDADSDNVVAANSESEMLTGIRNTPFRGAQPDCSQFRSMKFPRLPSSAREVESVKETWLQAADPRRAADNVGSTTVLTGRDASEEAVKILAPGRRVIHLATHGFFLGDDCPAGLAGAPSASTPGRSQEPGTLASNPLLLSGLALGGANRRATAPRDQDDGILTAEEIASLDLSGTECAILSACDTGLGKVQAGEGVLGLRRAFEIAGVGSLVMSLWPIPDDVARSWMQTLYRSRFGPGPRMSMAVAARTANLSVLNEIRNHGGSTNPRFWAGFVATGVAE
jgi:tetratricopeptide (TPR) repeat protein